MNKFVLTALLGAFAVDTAATEWEAVDDWRCHDEPNNPVIEPTPTPEDFPDPPTPITEWDPLQTPAPTNICTGDVTGFQIVDTSSTSYSKVMDLENGSLIKMSQLPSDYTVKVKAPTGKTVEMYLDDSLIRTDSAHPYTYTDGQNSELKQLYVKGSYKLTAKTTDDTGDESCTIYVDVIYDNPGVCQGIVKQFGLWDVQLETYVPGYENLADGQILQLDMLPEELTVVAVANGRGSGQAWLSFDDGEDFMVDGSPYGFAGKHDGKAKVWMKLREEGTIKLKGRLSQRPSQSMIEDPEDNCEITIHVKSHYECTDYVSSFTLVDANSDNEIAVMGYEKMAGNRVFEIDDNNQNRRYSIKANSIADKVRFWVNDVQIRTDGSAPFTLAGENSGWKEGETIVGDYKAYSDFNTPGTYKIEAKGKKYGSWESNSKKCVVTLRIDDSDPDESVTVKDHEDCKPAQIAPAQEGDYEAAGIPVRAIREDGDDVKYTTLKFKVSNTIKDVTMDWITTAFVTRSGVEVCDKVHNVTYNEEISMEYEAKCVDDMAFVDVYAYSDTFDATKATADTSVLPSGCRNPDGGKVVKYTYVLSCDCGEMKQIDETIVPGVDPEPPHCVGINSDVWGDPHINTFDSQSGKHWNCQEEGEFVMVKADLPDYDYDFELRNRFSRFGNSEGAVQWSFNAGTVVEQDVRVQLTMDNEVREHSNMFADVPVSFYVDGQPRKLHEGSGDHRVMVTRDGYDIQIFFVETGIHVYVLVRPLSVDDHITDKIPGSMSTFLCLPDSFKHRIQNIKGLLGTPGGGIRDDYMTPDGQTVEFKKNGNVQNYPSDSQGRQYCRDHWCVKAAAESKFVYETGQSHGTFDTCNNNRRLSDGSVTVYEETGDDDLDLREQFAALSDDVFDTWANCTACLEDILAAQEQFGNIAFGIEQARTAISMEEDAESGAGGDIQSDDACCSTDGKTCVDSAATGCAVPATDVECSLNLNEPYVLLSQGSYTDDPEDENFDCLAVGGTPDVDAGTECCPELEENDAGTCAIPAKVSQDERRRLHAVWQRPDRPSERNVVPLHEEL